MLFPFYFQKTAGGLIKFRNNELIRYQYCFTFFIKIINSSKNTNNHMLYKIKNSYIDKYESDEM